MEAWARSLGPVRAFGVEGTGSYGAGLSRFLRERGHAVVEVNRPDRRLRRRKGKSDPLDAEAAARMLSASLHSVGPLLGEGMELEAALDLLRRITEPYLRSLPAGV